VFPAALRGLMIAAFAAAYMSTIGTQLNWGASYLVNDFYKRFLRPGRGEKHYVVISQLATVSIMVLSCGSPIIRIPSRMPGSFDRDWRRLREAFLFSAGSGGALMRGARFLPWLPHFSCRRC